MATITTKPDQEVTSSFSGVGVPPWPRGQSASTVFDPAAKGPEQPSHRDALQALLAFSALHEQVRRRKVLAARSGGFDAGAPIPEFERSEQFLLDEVLQLVAERAVAITGADGLAIALAENNEIVLRTAAGTVRPDVGARIDRDLPFLPGDIQIDRAEIFSSGGLLRQKRNERAELPARAKVVRGDRTRCVASCDEVAGVGNDRVRQNSRLNQLRSRKPTSVTNRA